jgi:cytochrome c oxidase subunit 2
VTKTAQSINVHVIGHQWWWEFDYPDLGIVTANELHVPVNTNVYITLDSVDVIHSFWVPQLSGKTDVIPGQTNHMWFRADETGDYHGQCAEFCGLNHANMRIKVVVETNDDFKAWAKNQQQPPAQPQTAEQQQGYKILTTGICSNCHQLKNTVVPPGKNSSAPPSNTPGNGAYTVARPVGPNLGHLMSRSVFAGATFDLNEANLRRWLMDNQHMKPGNDMSLNPKPDELEPLIAYLTSLK